MKLKYTLFTLFLCTTLYTKAQTYVTIPDTHFAAWLNTNYPSCMSGNQMDITCNNIINETIINVSYHNISDLTGIEYFTHLQNLYCYNNHLTNLPILPNSLNNLRCNSNQLTSLPVLPLSILNLFCDSNQLTSLPSLPDSLHALYCTYNQLTSLPALPNSLLELACEHNQLTILPALSNFLSELWCGSNPLTNLPPLPNSLKKLGCWDNQLASIPALPDFMQVLICDNNQLTNLPTLPNSLYWLECTNNQLSNLPALPDSQLSLQLICSYNQLTSLPALPNSIWDLRCDHNQLTSLPTLTNSIQNLVCNNNQLTSLPILPNSLDWLDCSHNPLMSIPALPNLMYFLACSNDQLTGLPSLPNSIVGLFCDSNQLTILPVLPNSLEKISCTNNHLTSLPALPNSLQYLFCNNNNISCFPVFPDSIWVGWFNIDSNSFTCLPNYIVAMDSTNLAYPLCMLGDSVNNPNGCISTNGITGYTYKDNNTNCLKDSGDLSLVNIPLKLYDNNNNLLAQMYSLSNGVYNFVQPAGNHVVVIDTNGVPFTAQCPHPGVDSIVTTTTAYPLATDVNFAFTCKPGFDVGVQSVVANGWVFPGRQHTLKIIAGKMSHWYNLNCGAGVSGQIVVTVTGPVTYISPTIGALTPSASGNVFTYVIADFGSINNSHDFGLIFKTDTTAQGGDMICVNVSTTPIVGDNNINNNTYQYCYLVVNSHDPNMKEVYPVNVLPGYDGYFTYTIHFQNTGTAPANNIFLIDTLSNNFDLETFKVTNYSHNNIASLTGKVLTFRFPNIMLPDSSTDEPGSKGFVQYKIKPKGSLTAGTQIKNTAYIYFDYNAPIATNTTINEFSPLSIEDHPDAFQMSVYPNPVLDYATLIFTTTKAQQIQLRILDMLGQESLLLNQNVDAGTNNIQINTRTLAKGFYILSVRDESNEERTIKFLK